MGYVLLLGALICNGCANFLLKLGATRFAGLEGGLLRATVGNYMFIGGLLLFACNIVLYTLALSRLPLSIGYPIMIVGSLIVIIVLSALYLGEAVSTLQYVGIGLLFVGITLIYLK